MRKLNAIISGLLLLVLLLHGVTGSFVLLGVSNIQGKPLAMGSVGLTAVHTVLSAILTFRTIRAGMKSGVWYWRQNGWFWIRRLSGVAVLILIFCHIGLFGGADGGQYRLFEFTTVKLAVQLSFISALSLHVFTNVRPLLASLGVIGYKERRIDLFLIGSVLLLFFIGATVFYYIGWQFL
jgi:succinate dehydrogenase hydrophobic anchor subunit